jgi:hypothetical protein
VTAEGNIHLGPEDLLEGRLTFKGDVVVEGRVEGELRLTGRLSLRDGGAVVGDVRVARLQVEEGAVLHGNVRVGSNGAAEAAPAAERPPVVERAPVVEAVPEPEPEPTPEPTAEPEAEPVVAATAVEVAVEAPALVTEVAPAAVAVMEPEPAVAATSEDGFTQLFDGVSKTGWRLAGAGDFKVVDGTLEAAPDASGELGLLWHSEPTPRDFVLKLEWKLGQANDGSGIYLRFPDPGSKGYLNQAWVAVDFGIEVQVDEYGWPDRAGKHRTGAFYDQDGQTLSQRPGKPPGEWNDFEIRARGQEYTVLLNGEQVSRFRNKDRERAVASTAEAPTFIGLQINPPNQGQKQATGRVAFRNIRIKPL